MINLITRMIVLMGLLFAYIAFHKMEGIHFWLVSMNSHHMYLGNHLFHMILGITTAMILAMVMNQKKGH